MKRRRMRAGGRRVATGKRTRSVQRASQGHDAPLSQKERLHLVQLMVCGGIFVLLVAAKVLLPERMEAWNGRIAGALEQNMDVQSVFNAVGRAFSGEEEAAEAAEEIYRAVFAPEEGESVKTAVTVELEEAGALETLQLYRQEERKTEEPATAPDVSALAYVLYSAENLPDCVSLEQAILGFDYCSPLPGAALSSSFGYREHPTEGEELFHYGIDLAADSGTAVACFADGTVKAVGESSSYGKYCIVDHESGYSTLYAHCSRITAVSGAEVCGGDKIAEVGETGMATGPHLHFELQRSGTYLNPVYYVTSL